MFCQLPSLIRSCKIHDMGILYIVATPIGNLNDISLRAIETLTNSDLILCEDTRTSGIILSKLEIKKPLLSLHDNNEEIRIPEVLNALAVVKAGMFLRLWKRSRVGISAKLWKSLPKGQG